MRVASLLLMLFAAGCGCDASLIRSNDPRCDTTCYEAGGHPGVGVCATGKWVCDDNGDVVDCEGDVEPSPEECDGLDNDCDGRIDLQARPCTTACGTGSSVCLNAVWTDCSAPKPGVEVCDGFDNDCDGRSDEAEDLPAQFCYTGPSGSVQFGICRPGVMRCEDGMLVCRNQQLPQAEACDGLDNDCDGLVDEGMRQGNAYDFVFIIDDSCSMSATLNKVASSVNTFSTKYGSEAGFKFGLVRITDAIYDARPLLAQNLTDAQTFATAVSALDYNKGGGLEASYDGVYVVCNPANTLGLAWTPEAERILVMFTDEEGQSYRQTRIDESAAAAMAADNGFTAYMFVGNSHRYDFDDIATRTGGLVYDIYGTQPEIESWLDSIVGATCE